MCREEIEQFWGQGGIRAVIKGQRHIRAFDMNGVESDLRYARGATARRRGGGSADSAAAEGLVWPQAICHPKREAGKDKTSVKQT